MAPNKDHEASGTGPAQLGAPILIQLWVRTLEPVAGEAAMRGQPPASFRGWLDLLQHLSNLVASAAADSESTHLSERRNAR